MARPCTPGRLLRSACHKLQLCVPTLGRPLTLGSLLKPHSHVSSHGPSCLNTILVNVNKPGVGAQWQWQWMRMRMQRGRWMRRARVREAMLAIKLGFGPGPTELAQLVMSDISSRSNVTEGEWRDAHAWHALRDCWHGQVGMSEALKGVTSCLR